MAAEEHVDVEVSKHRRGVMTALLAILLVIAAIVAVAYAMEIGPFERADSDEPTVTTPEPGDSGSGDEPSEPAVALPPADMLEAMYFEQLASGATIQELVDDKFASLEITNVNAGTDAATLSVKATWRDGTSVNGAIGMRTVEDTWYVTTISREGNTSPTPATGVADEAVAKAIAEGCAANQEIPVAILKGDYSTLTIDKVTKGSGTAIVEVTFTGSAGELKGEITCISKEISGVTKWFVTGFAKA